MPLRVELWEDGALVDGAEEWWDGVERAVLAEACHYPLLTSINPYGDLTVPPDRLQDLAGECRRLAQSSSGRLRILMLKIADLCDRASAGDNAELRFNGD